MRYNELRCAWLRKKRTPGANRAGANRAHLRPRAHEAPETFAEAVQAIYFVQLIADRIRRNRHLFWVVWTTCSTRSVKRPEKGIITKEQAEELLDCLWLKIASIVQIGTRRQQGGGHPISQAVTLGGMDAKGNDATNELSYMLLETTARVHMPQPSVCVRIHRRTPRVPAQMRGSHPKAWDAGHLQRRNRDTVADEPQHSH